MTPSRRGLIVGAGSALLASAAPPVFADEPSLTLNGQWRQGGFAFGRTWPRAAIHVDGEPLTAASEHGLFVVGFDRDAGPSTTIEARSALTSLSRTLDIAPGTFPESRIDGLPPATVEPTDPALLERIKEEAALKAVGFASRIDSDDFRDGFVWPLESYRISSLWGAQRILNGTPARPHYGIDLAAPQGTPIRAPADGVVAFSRSGMHFEGGLVLIDHGQGLVSCYLHQSQIDVAVGQRLARGQEIGRVGMEGRATGPHLCWRMKWRDRNLDPSLMVGAATPTTSG
ncbi:MAG: M23 family metallopeptidase [Caulobacteraceae bacterium]|nr:M23 family metallopeptidase [Caulobacteraceae bacterium]